MKKSINHLGCRCNLPGDLSQTRFVCDNCQTRYERNSTVHRWYVEWTPKSKSEMEAATRPSNRLVSNDWANYVGEPSQRPTADPVAADVPSVPITGAMLHDSLRPVQSVSTTVIEIDTSNLSDTY